MIKAIIFDAGGVLQLWQNEPIYNDIQETMGLDELVSRAAFNEFAGDFCKGKISEKEFWKRFIAKTGTKKPLPKESFFLRTYIPRFKMDEQIVALLKRLKSNGYPLAVLTNCSPPHTAFNKAHGLYDFFDEKIISDEVGYLKPEKEIYEIALDRLQVKPEEAVFIDDLEENVKAAEALGIHGIWYKNPEQLKEALKKLEVKI